MTTTRGPVGTSPHRVGGRSRVTGLQKYVADIHFGDELHVKLVTLDSARARIVSIDTTKAAQVPGVLLVLTEKDLPQPVPRFGPQFQDRPVLAVGETKYHGEPVAAVAAETKDAAEEAASLVWVEYEPLPGVYTIADALDADAPIVQDSSTRPGDPFADTNVCSEHHFGWGDVDKVEAEADHVIERTYSFPMVTHFAIEPHGFMATPDGEDGVVVWSTIQHPFLLQKILAKILDLPLAKVRIIAPDPGGGFGGKQNPKFEPLVALMAIRTGRPVRLILSLEETFQAVRRAAAEVRVRMGFELDGTMVFTDVEAQFLIGAYVDIADRVVGKSSYLAAGPYRVPAVRVVGRGILSHTTPSTAFRGFGVPQLTWARESTLDEAALQLGIDPLEVRMRNLPAYQEEFIPGDTPADGDWAEAVRTGAELIGWDTPLLSGHGRGLAISIKSGPTTGLSYSTVRLLADGSVIIFCGTSDMGQGARTIFAQIAAHELGVELERVSVVMGDTAIVPYDQQTSASRSSVLMGTAVLRACRDVQQQVREMASKAHQIEVEEIVVDAGVVQFPDRETTIVEVAKAGMGRLGGELIGNGEMRKEPEPDHPLGGSAVFFEFNYTAIEVEVDEETGEIVIVRHVTVGDVGRSLNPNQVRGQDEGAAIMGLGHTLMEQIILDDSGRIRNLGALDYRIPTSQDLPVELTGVSVENADGPGPYGAKGLS
ncbi:MAG TPA: xanthine dehydrogenase, partial [Candidatus Latescibacteria bacterium]|nr:xanthine dehydrogenase [Candidatus Latescibacterota bacterium]